MSVPLIVRDARLFEALVSIARTFFVIQEKSPSIAKNFLRYNFAMENTKAFRIARNIIIVIANSNNLETSGISMFLGFGGEGATPYIPRGFCTN